MQVTSLLLTSGRSLYKKVYQKHCDSDEVTIENLRTKHSQAFSASCCCFHCSGVNAFLMERACISFISSSNAALTSLCLSNNLFPSNCSDTITTLKLAPHLTTMTTTTTRYSTKELAMKNDYRENKNNKIELQERKVPSRCIDDFLQYNRYICSVMCRKILCRTEK